jgi:hypothetical protein
MPEQEGHSQGFQPIGPPDEPPRAAIGAQAAAESPKTAEPPKNAEAGETIAPAEFPSGFWKGVDYLLQNPERIMESLRRDHNLWNMSTIFLTISLVMSALYGLVMGATNLLQGSSMPMWAKLVTIWVTAIKVPALFLLTLAIVLPPVYVSNAFAGARLPLRQMVTLLLAAITITVTLLASMATVAFFFALTSSSYSFIVLLHVTIFTYAGVAGLSYLVQTLQGISQQAALSARRPLRAAATPQWLFIAWLLLYMFVGTQLAWVMRPFIGSRTVKFQVFRPREGNFYEAVYNTAVNLSKQQSKARK